MKTSEAIEFVNNKWVTYLDKQEMKNKNEVIELLKRGEKYEKVVKEIDNAMSPGGVIEYDFNYENYLRNDAPDETYIKFMRNGIKKIKQKYFPKGGSQ